MNAREIYGQLFQNERERNGGYTAEELDRAETALGSSLPEGLRSFYREFGKLDINVCHNELLPPEILFFSDRAEEAPADSRSLKDRFLVFYEGPDHSDLWGVRWLDLEMVSPPVYVRPQGSDQWQICADSLDEFFIDMLFFQAYEGGADFSLYQPGMAEAFLRERRLDASQLEMHEIKGGRYWSRNTFAMVELPGETMLLERDRNKKIVGITVFEREREERRSA